MLYVPRLSLHGLRTIWELNSLIMNHVSNWIWRHVRNLVDQTAEPGSTGRQASNQVSNYPSSLLRQVCGQVLNQVDGPMSQVMNQIEKHRLER